MHQGDLSMRTKGASFQSSAKGASCLGYRGSGRNAILKTWLSSSLSLYSNMMSFMFINSFSCSSWNFIIIQVQKFAMSNIT